jgi:hypothetical protein
MAVWWLNVVYWTVQIQLLFTSLMNAKILNFYSHHEMAGFCIDFSHKTIQIKWINLHEALLLLGQENNLSNKILSYSLEYMLLLQEEEVQKVHQQ